jgi:hypothetical protein
MVVVEKKLEEEAQFGRSPDEPEANARYHAKPTTAVQEGWLNY